MQAHDLAELLRLKRAREARAGATLAKARMAEHQAQETLRRLEEAEAAHAVARPVREAEIYAKLLAGPLPSSNVQAATVRLGRLAAISGVLSQRKTQAVREAAAQTAAVAAARATQLRATRAVVASGLLQGKLAEAAAVAAERQQEDEFDELSSLRPGTNRGAKPGPGAKPGVRS